MTNLDGPSPELLATFVQFAELQEASAVARVLDLDPGGVSRRLAELQTRYGLLQARGKGRELTEKGRQGLPAVRSLLRQYHQLASWLASAESSPQSLCLAAGQLGVQLYVPRAVAHLAGLLPGSRVQVHVRRGRERVLGVARGSYDLALVSHNPGQIQAVVASVLGEGGWLEVEELATQPLCLIAGKGTEAAGRLERVLEAQEFPLGALAGVENLIGPDAQSGVRRQLEKSLQGRVVFQTEAPGWAAAREYARVGLGAAIVPLSLLKKEDCGGLVIRMLPEAVAIRERAIYRSGQSEGGQALLLAMRKAVDDHQREVQRCWRGVLFL